MREIVIVMRTVNRLEAIVPNELQRRNYLGDTLRNFARGGVFESQALHSFHVVDSGSTDQKFFDEEWCNDVPVAFTDSYLYPSSKRLTPNENAGRALRIGVEANAPWVLFCEDDIDVCANFLESVLAWLKDHEREDRRLYSFGNVHSQANPKSVVHISIEAFFGTTCYALRREDAKLMADFVAEKPLYDGGDRQIGVGVCHDLHFHQWSRKYYPQLDFFCASAPAFVQHIGDVSGISTRTNKITYDSWPGREWSYHG